MKLYYLCIICFFIYSPTLFLTNTLQLNYSNIFSMERSMNCSGSHPKPMAFTRGTPTKQNPCKAQIEFLPAITPQKSMWYSNQKQNTTYQRSSASRSKLPYLQILHIFTELIFNAGSYIKPEQNQTRTPLHYKQETKKKNAKQPNKKNSTTDDLF